MVLNYSISLSFLSTVFSYFLISISRTSFSLLVLLSSSAFYSYFLWRFARFPSSYLFLAIESYFCSVRFSICLFRASIFLDRMLFSSKKCLSFSLRLSWFFFSISPSYANLLLSSYKLFCLYVSLCWYFSFNLSNCSLKDCSLNSYFLSCAVLLIFKSSNSSLVPFKSWVKVLISFSLSSSRS